MNKSKRQECFVNGHCCYDCIHNEVCRHCPHDGCDFKETLKEAAKGRIKMSDGDLISRASLLAAIAELKESPWYNFGKVDGTSPEGVEVMWYYGYLQRKEAVEIIEDMCIRKELAVLADSGWISVKERLPENDGLYIVCKTVRGHQISFEARWKGNKWLSVIKNNQLDYITHWQPLPGPPKEECDWVDDDSLPNEDMRPDNEVI
ncbi:MAG: DUF551 domain-containing protein [Ruminococcus sp.]|uniref:DUF551 domain-containing protein n=1 Tax=Ruminococcus sp. TaxID=41978 RepID=UPI0025FF2C29|nr:DUF551 domain-containing protein [Ruminococcus sp.]MBR0530027.1 DUF551 domain-containing protein [Ruminococcus sp.]